MKSLFILLCFFMIFTLPINAFSQTKTKSNTIQIKTNAKQYYQGYIDNLSTDSFFLKGELQDPVLIKISDITSIKIIKKSTFWRNTGLGAGGGAVSGATLLLLAGGEDDFTAGERMLAGGIVCGGLGTLIMGTFSGFRSVDVELPWKYRSDMEKGQLLAQLASGTYRHRWQFGFSPFLGNLSAPNIDASATQIGGKIRFHFKPRAGMELAFARTGWFNSHSGNEDPLQQHQFNHRSQLNYFSVLFISSFCYQKRVNPYAAWGFAYVAEKYHFKARSQDSGGTWHEFEDKWTNNSIPLQLFGGIDVPVTHWLSLDARVGLIWYWWQEGSHFCYQVGINFNPKLF